MASRCLALVMLAGLAGLASPVHALSYPAVDKYILIKVEQLVGTDTYGPVYANVNAEIRVQRPVSNEPSATVSSKFTYWLSGMGQFSYTQQAAFMGSIVEFPFDQQVVWSRSIPHEYKDNTTRMPGGYSVVIKTGTTKPVFTKSLDIANFTDLGWDDPPPVVVPPGGGGTGDPPDGTGKTYTSLTDGDKAWWQTLFSVTPETQDKVKEFRGHWNSMGPWGQLETAKFMLAGADRGSQPEPTTVRMPWMRDAKGGYYSPTNLTIGLNSTAPIAATSGDTDALTPWHNAVSVSDYREAFRTIIGYVLDALGILGIVAYCKGKVSV